MQLRAGLGLLQLLDLLVRYLDRLHRERRWRWRAVTEHHEFALLAVHQRFDFARRPHAQHLAQSAVMQLAYETFEALEAFVVFQGIQATSRHAFELLDALLNGRLPETPIDRAHRERAGRPNGTHEAVGEGNP